MPEKEKKIVEVEKTVKDILDRVVQMEVLERQISQLERERDSWKKKYDELKMLYDKCWL
jgi:peptidoglycan hydrolase CwlO-like protein